MNDFNKILKAIEKGGYELTNSCDPNTYDYWEWSDSKEIIIYLGNYSYGFTINFNFDKDGNLIEIC